MNRNTERLQAALSYAARGWPVFPVRGKKPMIRDWTNMATTDPNQIKAWFTGPYAGANIGIVTGYRSGFCALDVDKHDADADGEAALAALESQHGALLKTVEQLTGGGGLHVLFRMPKGVKLTNRTGKNAIAPGLEIKADGGYIVVAPSIRRPYVWEVEHHPDDTAIADAPEWLIKLATSKPNQMPQTVDHSAVVVEGGRNVHLASLAGIVRRRGMSEAAILAVLRVENEAQCQPPLSDTEVSRIAKSVARYEPEAVRVGENSKLNPSEANFFTQDGQFLPASLADFVANEYHFAVQSQALYVYRDGVYTETTMEFIKSRCKEILAGRYRDTRGTEVAKQIITSCWQQGEYFINDLHGINVANGILDWSTGTLKPHYPEYHSRVQIPVTYQPSADCPRIKQFLTDVLPQDCRWLALELFGHCLIPDVSMQKAFLLKSGGESGKSVFLDLLTAFLGRQNVSHEKLQALGENRFRAANLQGKLANVFADLPSCYLEDTDIFKVLVSGDALSAERKGRDPFSFRNTARLLFSANELPRSADNSHGFFRRWIIIDFPNRFPPGHPSRDEKLIDKLTTPQELSGLLNLALDGLRRLKSRGYFEEPASCRAELDEYKRTNDSVRLFCDERLLISSGAQIEKTYLFYAYKNFCTDENLKPVSARKLYHRVKEFNPAVFEVMIHGVRYFRGISLDE